MKRGRKTLPKGRARTKLIVVPVRPSEHKKLQRLAGRGNLAGWIRTVMFRAAKIKSL